MYEQWVSSSIYRPSEPVDAHIRRASQHYVAYITTATSASGG